MKARYRAWRRKRHVDKRRRELMSMPLPPTHPGLEATGQLDTFLKWSEQDALRKWPM